MEGRELLLCDFKLCDHLKLTFRDRETRPDLKPFLVYFTNGYYLCLAGTVSYWALAALVLADDHGVLAAFGAAPATGVLQRKSDNNAKCVKTSVAEDVWSICWLWW